ncbi:hypothetical protein SAMN04488007_1211 [Maribacter aquivivus]|uniref:Uncharacterized protein n=1 Tax=Maribacter aquivivus TaxID=228958 RepID=A0A1M6LLS4_9FLAO|nr:hypothetical protein [Maribacter aquivivus]SHJ72128.1 hypothetical protein SAMN04488007_1211 [Maribacter aquivivus]
MILNLFKSSSKQKKTKSLYKNSVTHELNSLLNDLTIVTTKNPKDDKADNSIKEKASSLVSSLERQIEENQILYAKIMQERMMRTRRKLM